MKKSEKELKKFKKLYLESGEEQVVCLTLTKEDFAYYNVMLKDWVVENGTYEILVGSSSRDIHLKTEINYNRKMPYSTTQTGTDMMGDISEGTLIWFGE